MFLKTYLVIFFISNRIKNNNYIWIMKNKEWIVVFCGECGAKNEKGAQFCAVCGAKLEQEEQKKEKNNSKKNVEEKK